uniref:Uncharacterized protein n=1 Tax=Arion vulgaris TaxID=1028688 RepID=A0A0B6YR68_9EUPU
MDNSSRKPSLKKLKSKLIAKLFGQPHMKNVIEVQTLQDENFPGATSSSTPNSGLEGEARAEEVRLYGAQCCPLGPDGKGIFRSLGSSSYLSDDEGSGSDLAPISNKRKKRCVSVETRKQAKRQVSTSSSSSSQAIQIAHQINNPSNMAGSTLTKTQKKKVKKTPKNAERKTDNAQYTEFTSDSN